MIRRRARRRPKSGAGRSYDPTTGKISRRRKGAGAPKPAPDFCATTIAKMSPPPKRPK